MHLSGLTCTGPEHLDRSGRAIYIRKFQELIQLRMTRWNMLKVGCLEAR